MITEQDIHRGAILWCSQKERETFSEDITYFTNMWRSFPGLNQYVQQAHEERLLNERQ